MCCQNQPENGIYGDASFWRKQWSMKWFSRKLSIFFTKSYHLYPSISSCWNDQRQISNMFRFALRFLTIFHIPHPPHPTSTIFQGRLGGCQPAAKHSTAWQFCSTCGKLPSSKASSLCCSSFRAKAWLPMGQGQGLLHITWIRQFYMVYIYIIYIHIYR